MLEAAKGAEGAAEGAVRRLEGERQALEWLEKAKEWAQVLKEAFEEVPEKRDGAEAVLKRAEIRFRNGSRILAIPANPKTARGWSSASGLAGSWGRLDTSGV